MVDNKTGGPAVYQNADGSFRQAKGKLTSMPQHPKISNLAPAGTFDDHKLGISKGHDKPKKSKPKKAKKKSKKHLSKGSNFGPNANFGTDAKREKRQMNKLKTVFGNPKKVKTTQGRTRGPDKKTIVDADKKKESRPMSSKLIGQRILGLRAEMKKTQAKINKSTHLLKAQRKEVKAKQTELFDLMDNTEQLNLPFKN